MAATKVQQKQIDRKNGARKTAKIFFLHIVNLRDKELGTKNP